MFCGFIVPDENKTRKQITDLQLFAFCVAQLGLEPRFKV